MNNKTTNILIIGSGLAGAVAALTAAQENQKVILLTKCKDLLSGNTPWAQGGIAYPQNNDSTFVDDVLLAGDHHNDVNAVNQLMQKGPDLIDELLIKKCKVPFEKDQQNQFIFTSEAAHSINRIIHCKDQTGQVIHRHVIREVKNHKNITIYSK